MRKLVTITGFVLMLAFSYPPADVTPEHRASLFVRAGARQEGPPSERLFVYDRAFSAIQGNVLVSWDAIARRAFGANMNQGCIRVETGLNENLESDPHQSD